MADPTTDDVTALANALREAERLGLIQADSIAHHVWPVIVERDARVRAEAGAEAIRSIAEALEIEGFESVATELRERADVWERGESL